MIERIDLVLRDVQAWELSADIWTLSGLMHELPLESGRRAEILLALQRAIDVADPDDLPGTVAEARAELADVLSRPASASAHRTVAVGPRPHRQRLVVADPGDDPQVRADVLQRRRSSPTPTRPSSSRAPRPSSTPG